MKNYKVTLDITPALNVAALNVMLANLKTSLGSLGGEIKLLDANKIQSELNATAGKVKQFGAESTRAFKTASQSASKMKVPVRKLGEEIVNTTQKATGFQKIVGAAFNFNQIYGSIQTLSNSLNEVVMVGDRFETKLREVGAFTGQSGKNLENLGKKARQLGIEFASIGKASEQIDIFGQILSKFGPSYGENADALALLTRNVNVLAKAGGVDAKTAFDTMGNAMLQFGLVTGDSMKDAETSTQIINQLAAAARAGAAEIPQTGEALLQVGGAAVNANISVRETLAAVQTLAVGGKVGAEAGVSLRNVIGMMQRTTGEGNEALEEMGLTASQLGETLTTQGLGAAIKLLKGGLENLPSSYAKNNAIMRLFGLANQQAFAILSNNVDKIDEFDKAISEGELGQGTAFEMFNQKSGTASDNVAKLKSIVEDAFISISKFIGTTGQTVLMASAQFAPLITSFASLKTLIPTESIKKFALSIGSKLLPSLIQIPGAATAATAGMGATGVAGATAGKAVSVAWGPVLLIIGAVALALAGLYLFFTKTDMGKSVIEGLGVAFNWVIEAVKTAGNWLGKVFSDIGKWIGSIMPILKTIGTVLVAVLITPLLPMITLIKLIVKNWESILGVLKSIGNFITTVIMASLQGIVAIIKSYISIVKTVVDAIKTAFQSAFNFVKNAINSVFSFFTNTTNGIFVGIRNKAVSVFNTIKGAVEPVFNFIKGGLEDIWNIAKSVVDGIVSALQWIGIVKKEGEKTTGTSKEVKKEIPKEVPKIEQTIPAEIEPQTDIKIQQQNQDNYQKLIDQRKELNDEYLNLEKDRLNKEKELNKETASEYARVRFEFDDEILANADKITNLQNELRKTNDKVSRETIEKSINSLTAINELIGKQRDNALNEFYKATSQKSIDASIEAKDKIISNYKATVDILSEVSQYLSGAELTANLTEQSNLQQKIIQETAEKDKLAILSRDKGYQDLIAKITQLNILYQETGDISYQTQSQQTQQTLNEYIANFSQSNTEIILIDKKTKGELEQNNQAFNSQIERLNILAIKDRTVRERELLLYENRRTLEEDLKLAEGNISKMTEAWTNYALNRVKIEKDSYVASRSALSVYTNLMTAFANAEPELPQMDTSGELDKLKQEEADLRTSFENRKVSYVEYIRSIDELNEKRRKLEKANDLSFWEVLKAQTKAGLANMVETTTANLNELSTQYSNSYITIGNLQRELHTNMNLSDQERAEKEKEMANITQDQKLIEIQAYQQLASAAVAAIGQLIMGEENFGKTMAKLLSQSVVSVIRILEGKIIAESLAQPDSVSTFGATGFARIAILVPLLESAAALVLALGNAAGRKSGGKIKGGEQFYRVNELGEEFVVNHRATLKNVELLEFLNNGGEALDFYMKKHPNELFRKESFREIISKTNEVIPIIVDNSKTERAISSLKGDLNRIEASIERGNYARKEFTKVEAEIHVDNEYFKVQDRKRLRNLRNS